MGRPETRFKSRYHPSCLLVKAALRQGIPACRITAANPCAAGGKTSRSPRLLPGDSLFACSAGLAPDAGSLQRQGKAHSCSLHFIVCILPHPQRLVKYFVAKDGGQLWGRYAVRGRAGRCFPAACAYAMGRILCAVETSPAVALPFAAKDTIIGRAVCGSRLKTVPSSHPARLPVQPPHGGFCAGSIAVWRYGCYNIKL